MKLKFGYTLKQLLEAYGKEIEIPESLINEKISIYGLSFIEAIKRKESWIDPAVESYLESKDFFNDLQRLKTEWENRLDCNDYWLDFEYDNKTKKFHLTEDMDLKY